MIFCPPNVTCLPSAVAMLQSIDRQNPMIEFAEKTRFPCLYYIVCVKIDDRVAYENTYVLGQMERGRVRDETVIIEYAQNAFLAFFPKDEFSPLTTYQIAFEDDQWMVFTYEQDASLQSVLGNSQSST